MSFSRKLEDEKVKVSIPKIYNTRKRVFDALAPFCGSVLTSASINSAASALSFCMPKACIDFAFSQDILMRHLRQPMTLKDAELVAAKIAGKIDRIMQGLSVSDLDWRIASDWGVIKILGVEKAVRAFKDGNIQKGAWLDLEVLSGPASAYRYRKFWSTDMINYAKFRIGFSYGDNNNKYPYMDEATFTNLYFLGFFNHLSTKDRPDYAEFLCNDYIVSKNRELLRKRYRAIHKNNNFECPKNYPASVNCHRCPIGLSECEAATHLCTYEEKECKVCRQIAWIDPLRPEKCIDCAAKTALNLVPSK
jgi:hypothetical protein